MDHQSKTHKNHAQALLSHMLKAKEGWLMERILGYAIQQGYAVYTSTLKEAWRLSIAGLSASIMEGLNSYEGIPEMTPDEVLSQDPVALFGIIEAQRHRERGVSLNMFLGLMKYYRQSYIDMIRHEPLDVAIQDYLELFITRLFDKMEIGFCCEWAGSNDNNAIHEMQINNRMMTNEKNKYLTIFESTPNPTIILNSGKKIDNMNLSAARLFNENMAPGSQYYCASRDRQLEAEQILDPEGETIDASCFGGIRLGELLPWLEEEVKKFHHDNSDSMVFEKDVKHESHHLVFRVRLAKNLDVSGKFTGTIIILEDITSLKNAIAEIRTLQGFLPICSYCKNIRNDEGFWQKIEAYVSERSEAKFSHSICPACAKKYFPDIDMYGDKEES